MSGPGPTAPCPAGGPERRSRRGEEGFSLIEVIIAVVVLLVILLPIGSLLVTTDQVVAGSRYRAVAQQLASSDLSEVEATSATLGTPPTSGTWATQPTVTTPSSPTTWSTPISGKPTVTDVVDGEDYAEYVDGGWCTPIGSGSQVETWGAASGGGTPASLAYVVAVKVVWGPTIVQAGSSAPATDSVVTFAAVPPSSSGWTLPSGNPTTDCPAGLS
ncbi:MAG: prepilin-type N-terminal cleavage/methylation domain-containing protein [Actinomycetota bacterium]|nr:prepilin-type N-terminal cleavage/methylation domain-containing protein [Actinomycetota bacterium]